MNIMLELTKYTPIKTIFPFCWPKLRITCPHCYMRETCFVTPCSARTNSKNLVLANGMLSGVVYGH